MIPFLGPGDPFPPVEQALDNPDGLLAAGGALTTKRLIEAYRRGIFPWFNEGDPILWWSPDPRTILKPGRVHVSHSLRKRIRKAAYFITLDRAFARVLDGCAAPRAGDPLTGSGSSRAERNESHTWLSPAMRRAYTALHNGGLAHSVEVWMDGELAGGVYGVGIGRMFFGESMFSRRTDASKVGIAVLAEQLDRWGFPLIDCQLETAHLVSLGAEPMPRRRFVAEIGRLVNEMAPAWVLDGDLAGTASHAPRAVKRV